MDTNPLDIKATAGRLEKVAVKGHLDESALERARHLAGHIPDPPAWQKFLDMALLVLGAAFAISGVFFFFAYNWADLHHFVKFGLIEAGLLGAVGLAFYLGLDRLPGQIALTVAALLVGVLLAVFGQVYQTGADAYQLFLGWSLLIAGWVVISRFSPLWLGWLGLFNITLITYWNQIIGESSSPAMYITLFALDGVSLLAWEVAHRRGVAWLQHRWLPRLIFPVALIFLVIPTLDFIFTSDRSGFFLTLAPVLYIAFTAFTIFFYQKHRSDLFILTVAALGIIIVVTSAVIQIFDIEFDDALVLLIVSLLIIGQTALAVNWLRRVAKSWETPHV